MNLSQFSVKNSLLMHVVSAFLIIAGIISVVMLKRELFPSFSFDIVLVQTAYPGATPLEIEKLITIPIEDELKEVDDIKEMTSVSAEGFSVITLKIEEDLPNPDKVINNIQRAVDRTQDLPDDLDDKPLVTEISTKKKPIIMVSLAGDLSEAQLQEYALGLERQVLDLDGVAQVSREGWREKEIWVEVDPKQMAMAHVGLNAIAKALQRQNVSIPGGTFNDNQSEYALRTSGEFKDASEIGDVIIRANASGQRLTIKDVAKVKQGFEEEKVISKTKGTRAINLTIIKKESGDTIDIVEATHELVENFKKIDDKLEISFLNDTSYYIKRRLNVLINNGSFGMLFVVLSLFTFLSMRVAIAACMGIPIAVLGTFMLMYGNDISINLLSMFGMIMVIGMLVDEEIVMSENIYRYLENKESPHDAILKGSAEVSRAVIATVATTVAAFIPLFLMSGITGKFVRNIPVVVNYTLLSSLFVALLILPSHIYHLTKTKGLRETSKFKSEEKKFFRNLVDGYTNLLKKLLARRYLTTLVCAIVLLLSLAYGVTRMNFVLFPSRGIEIFFLRVEGIAGDPLKVTEAKIKPLEKLIGDLPESEVDNYVTQIGLIRQDEDDPNTTRGTHVGQITVYLEPEADRERSTAEIIESLRPQVMQTTGWSREPAFEMMRHGPPVGKPIDVQIRGDDLETLVEIAKLYRDELTQIKGVTDVRDDSESVMDIMKVKVDYQKAAEANLSVAEIATTIRTAFEGTVATSIKNTEEEIDVVVKLPLWTRKDQNQLNNLLIANNSGSLIPLNRVARLVKEQDLKAIKHFKGTRAINVTAQVDEENATVLDVNQHLEEKFKDLTLNYPGYTVFYGGESQETKESLMSLLRALMLSFGLILLILISMFRSLILPFVVLGSLPFAAIGVILAFSLHGLPLSFMALLGAIGLTGVVANSSIIMIDFIQKHLKDGGDTLANIVKGAQLRFRPIVLTSITTALGVIPAAYGLGGLDPFIQPMALTMNYGLIFGAGISLFLVPCLIAIVEDVKKRKKT